MTQSKDNEEHHHRKSPPKSSRGTGSQPTYLMLRSSDKLRYTRLIPEIFQQAHQKQNIPQLPPKEPTTNVT